MTIRQLRGQAWLGLALAAFLLPLTLAALPGAAGASPAGSGGVSTTVDRGTGGQTPGGQTSPSTSNNLLVDGEEAGGVPTTAATTVPPEGNGNEDGLSTEVRVWAVIAALLVVALLIGLLTWRYWNHTRPVAMPSQRHASEPVARHPRPPRRVEPPTMQYRTSNLRIENPTEVSRT